MDSYGTVLGICMVLFGLAIAGLIGTAIAHKKKRAFAGFLLGFFLGPLGWIFAWAIEDKGPKCPHCGGKIEEGYSTCKNCGKSIETDAKSKLDI